MPVYEYIGKKKRTWKVEVFLGYREDGTKNIHKKSGFITKTEAKKHENDILYKHNKGTLVLPSDKLFSTYIDEWLKRRSDKIGSQTYNTYDSNIKTHIKPSIGKVPLGKLCIQHIEKLMDELIDKKLAAGTRKKIYHILNNSLTDAVNRKEIPENVVLKEFKPSIQQKIVNVWDADDVKRFVYEAKGLSKYYIACLLPLYTGCRQGEVLGLRWKDIDFNRRVLRVTQTLSHDGKEFKPGAKTATGVRVVALSKATIEALRQHQEMSQRQRRKLGDEYMDNDLVICKENGMPINPRDINKTFDRLIKKLNLPRIKYHETRHTHASLLLLANVHPKVVCERLGHKNIGITLDLYTHLLPHMQDSAVTKLDEVLDAEEAAYKTMTPTEHADEATGIENVFEATDQFDNMLHSAAF